MPTQYNQQQIRRLILWLQPPPSLFVSQKRIDLNKDLVIHGMVVEANDVPWDLGLVADLLIDQETRSFVGLTFAISCDENWAAVRRLCERLEPSLVRYNLIVEKSDQLIYPDETG